MKKIGKVSWVDPHAARNAVARHINKLQASNNGVQFQAQIYEREAVDTLVALMRDEEMPPSLRRQCALDVATLARGQPKVWLHDGETIDPNAQGAAGFGATVAQEIEATTISVDLHLKLADYTRRNIHPRDWPEEVRAVATDMVNYYETEDVELLPPD